jgi:hypothetical protein
MKEKTFPWLLMQNNTFQPTKRNERFFFIFLNADKAKRKNINKSKKPRKTSGLIADRTESLQEITL